VSQVLARLINQVDVATHPELAEAFLTFAGSQSSPNVWRQHLLRMAERCESASHHTSRGWSVYVSSLLELIDARYHDPDLKLSTLTTEVDLSLCHLSRALKRETGRGFLAHVHERRVTAAHALLLERRLTVKEIAARVGYKSVTQFDRHYKRRYGMTPGCVRMNLRRRVS
jgi:AraC-like DNA-binding protein